MVNIFLMKISECGCNKKPQVLGSIWKQIQTYQTSSPMLTGSCGLWVSSPDKGCLWAWERWDLGSKWQWSILSYYQMLLMLLIPSPWFEVCHTLGRLPRWLSGKEWPVVQETGVQFLGQEDPLEEEVATRSSILVWETPWTEEPGGLYSPWGFERVGHNLATKQQEQQIC